MNVVHLFLGRRWILEFVERCCNIARHGNINPSGCVIPIKGESAEKGSIPIGGDGIQLSEGGDEMFRVVLAYILYSKVVDYKGERDVARRMPP